MIILEDVQTDIFQIESGVLAQGSVLGPLPTTICNLYCQHSNKFKHNNGQICRMIQQYCQTSSNDPVTASLNL